MSPRMTGRVKAMLLEHFGEDYAWLMALLKIRARKAGNEMMRLEFRLGHPAQLPVVAGWFEARATYFVQVVFVDRLAPDAWMRPAIIAVADALISIGKSIEICGQTTKRAGMKAQRDRLKAEEEAQKKGNDS